MSTLKEYSGLSGEQVFSLVQAAEDASKRASTKLIYPTGAALYNEANDNCITGPNFLIDALKGHQDHEGHVYNKDDKLFGHRPNTHAETGLLFDHSGTHMAITVPSCGYCMKNIAERFNALNGGLRALFFPAAAFKTKWFKENQERFDGITKLVAQRAGIELFKVNLTKRKIKNISLPTETDRTLITQDDPVSLIKIDGLTDIDLEDISEIADEIFRHLKSRIDRSQLSDKADAAMIIGRDSNGNFTAISAVSSLPPGFSMKRDSKLHAKFENAKYTLHVDPVCRALLAAQGYGVNVKGGVLLSTRLPQPDKLMDALHMGIETTFFLDTPNRKTEQAIGFMNFLQRETLMSFCSVAKQ